MTKNVDFGLGNTWKTPYRSRRTIWLIVFCLLAFFLWASNAPLDEVVRGPGKVVPTMKTQIVQNLEGGIVRQIFVTEGDIVEAGQRVALMDDTQFQSNYQELKEQRLALMLKLQRLQAEKSLDDIFVPDAALASQAPEYAASEEALFLARRKSLNSDAKMLAEMARLRRQEVDILYPMLERAAIPEIEIIRAEQAAVNAEGQISSTLNDFEKARAQEYFETLARLRQIEEQVLAREDQLHRTNVVTPVRGIVNRVSATTIGGVIRPGDPLVEVLPLNEDLRVEGRIDPRDIGFVFVGMPSTIKLTAFDFSVYGTLSGKVVHVGADTVIDEVQRDASPYYEVFIELSAVSLKGPSGDVAIRPGMQAEVELKSGERTVMEYLLKPIFKTSVAFSER